MYRQATSGDRIISEAPVCLPEGTLAEQRAPWLAVNMPSVPNEVYLGWSVT
jgi:hypothetical protein